MASSTQIALSALKNFQLDQSVISGGAASIATVGIGAVLVAMGVSVPLLNVPLTMAMVMGAAIPIGHFITALVPATKSQQADALAIKIGVAAEHLNSFIPQIIKSFPPETKDQAVAQAAVAPPNDSFNQPSV